MKAKTYEQGVQDGHDSAIRYVLGYLNGTGDCGSTAYEEILHGCGREQIIASARKDGEMKFTGLDQYLRRERKYERWARDAAQQPPPPPNPQKESEMDERMTLGNVSAGLRTNADDLDRMDMLPMLANHLRNAADAIDAHNSAREVGK